MTEEERYVRYVCRIMILECLAAFFTTYSIYERDTFERSYDNSCLPIHLLDLKCGLKLKSDLLLGNHIAMVKCPKLTLV